MKKRRSRRRRSRRRRLRRRTARRRTARRRRSRKKRRGGLGFRNSAALKSVKKPYDCSEEKKEIERLRQELALRTPKKVFDPRFDTPQSTKSTRAMWAKPSPHKPTASTSRVLSFNNDNSPRDSRWISPPNSPNRGGRRRRRRQKRGGRWSPYNKDWSSLPKNYRVMIQYHGPGRGSASGDGNSTAYGNFQLKDNVFKRIGKAQDGDGGPDSIEKYRVTSVWFWDDTPRLDGGNYNSQGGRRRRRTRKQRGGICPSCIAPLMILPLLGKNKKKKGRRP